MFKELSSDVENFVTPDHGCLIGWAKQGLQIIWWFLTKLLLMKYEIKNALFFYLTHLVFLYYLKKPENLEIMSFYLIAACCFANNT